MNKRQLYESIMKNVAKLVKKALNEGEVSKANYRQLPEEGSIVQDYNGLRWEVIKAGSTNIWDKVKKYDESGAMEDEIEYLDPDAIIVACEGIDEGDNTGEKAVFVYGPEGVEMLQEVIDQSRLNDDIYEMLVEYYRKNEENNITIPVDSIQPAFSNFMWKFYKGKIDRI